MIWLMLKRFSILLILLTTLFFVSCTDNNKSYIGEGDNWQVTYQRDEAFIIKYIGDSEIPQQIRYNIDQGSRTIDGHDELQDGVLKINSQIDNSNKDNINIYIYWNDNSEKIELIK